MASPSLEVHILGELQILRQGCALDLPASRKTRALLGYLVAVGEAQPRSRLCELFWDGPLDPRAALRWSLTKLRPLLDDEGARRLCGGRERVSWVAAGARVDLLELRALVAPGAGTPVTAAVSGVSRAGTEALEAAAALFRGELLEGLDLPDCYRYQEWLLAEREAARRLRSAVLAELVARRGGGLAGALVHARAWVGIDPLDEAAHAAVVRLLGELGQGRDALAQYERCRRILNDELGTRPSAVLEEARLSLRLPPGAPGIRVAAEPPPAEPRSSAAAAEPPPVGRVRELEQISRLLDAAAGGHAPPVLLLAGEPGIGKSRLLGALAAAARARGGVVLYGRAFEAEMVRPYGAWIDALRSAPLDGLAAPLQRELAPLLSELGPAPAGSGGRTRLFDAVLQFLAGRGAGGAPTALLLDDLQWIDEASAALLHYVARAAGGSRLLCACAARPGELADSVAGRRLVRALGRERRLCQLDLTPLSEEATAELVRQLDPGLDPTSSPSALSAAPSNLARVFTESGGNPLFAIEIARALARGEIAGALSESLGGLLRDRLWRLDGRAREILPWAAALGRAFDLETLEAVCALPAAELISGLEELERHAILRATEVGVDFTHDLLRAAAYQQISEPRCRLVHRRIARALAALPDAGGALAADVSHHAALGGEHELAAAAAVTAGERSLRLFAPVAAAELAERGLHHLGALPGPVRLRLHIDLLKVYVHSSLGRRRSPELVRELAQLVEEANGAGLHAQARTGLYLLAVLSEEGGDFAAAQRFTLQAAEQSRAADPATAARGLGNTGRCLAQLECDHPRAVALLHEADDLARRCGVEVIDIPWGLGLTCQFAGDEEQAIRYLESALAIARRNEDHWATCECMARLGQIDLEAGRPAAVLARTPELRRVAAKLGEGSEGPMAEALEALARLALGEGGAGERLEQALASLRAIDTKGLLAYAQNFAAEVDLCCGRLDQAARRAAEALHAATAVDRQSQIALAHSCLARCALLARDAPAAELHLQSLAAVAAADDRLGARARRAIADLQS
jgi:DNA-binding SARP family transcriptional activator/tetratricopeptide (TPR) repeat protein